MAGMSDLKRAAEVVRELAQACEPQSRWLVSADGERVVERDGTLILRDAGTVQDSSDPVYAATMDPAVGLALADLLDELADSERSLAVHDGLDPCLTIDGYAQAKALAAAILREA